MKKFITRSGIEKEAVAEAVKKLNSRPATSRLTWEDRRNYFAAWQSSSMTQKAFCQHYCIPLKTFAGWITAFKKQALEKEKTKTVERVSSTSSRFVEVVHPTTTSPSLEGFDMDLILKNGIVIKFTQLSLESLKKVVREVDGYEVKS